MRRWVVMVAGAGQQWCEAADRRPGIRTTFFPGSTKAHEHNVRVQLQQFLGQRGWRGDAVVEFFACKPEHMACVSSVAVGGKRVWPTPVRGGWGAVPAAWLGQNEVCGWEMCWDGRM